MELTKYQHACFAVNLDGQTLLVDPGNLTLDIETVDNLSAVVITHEHSDHCDEGLLRELVGDETMVYAPQSVLDGLSGMNGQAVEAGEVVEVGPFRLEFFGGKHATIHPSIPTIANLGVMINDAVYYPGDSFELPEVEVSALMLPVAAPWMKIAEAIDYVNRVEPRLVIPTHDAILSLSGQAIVDRLVSSSLPAGADYKRLDGTIEL